MCPRSRTGARPPGRSGEGTVRCPLRADKKVVPKHAAGHTRHMDEKYSVTVFSSSAQPKDWGRALAEAMAQLLVLCDGDRSPGRERFFGQQLNLVVVEKDDGADITIAWTPQSPA